MGHVNYMSRNPSALPVRTIIGVQISPNHERISNGGCFLSNITKQHAKWV